jgi:biotin carboxyl carrier protein
MEMDVVAPASGRVSAIRCQPGRTVRAGDIVLVLEGAA